MRSTFTSLTLALLLAFAGCASQPVDTSDPLAKLIVSSQKLKGKIRLTDPRIRPAGQFMQAQVLLENRTGERYDLEYRIDWQDHQGFAAGNEGAWQFVTLNGYGSESLSSTSKVPEGTRIVVTVRQPRSMF